MVEMLCTSSIIGKNAKSPLCSFTISPKRPEVFASPKQAIKPILRPRFGIDPDPDHTLFADALFKAIKPILRPRFGIDPDPDHTLFADALFIRRSKTDGLLKQQII